MKRVKPHRRLRWGINRPRVAHINRFNILREPEVLTHRPPRLLNMEPLLHTVLLVTANLLTANHLTVNKLDMERLPTVHRADIAKGA
jgi:hypothetical protein